MEHSLVGFNGQYPAAGTGHYHSGNGYRTYSSPLRRFTKPDSCSPFGDGGINPYAYCLGDPVNRADPTGHMSVGQWIGMGIGVMAGVVLSLVTEGMALPAVVSFMATVAGDAVIGAGSELMAEAIDGKGINWRQVGIAAGMSVAAVFAGYGLGRASRLNALRRPFSALMMAAETGDAAGEVAALAQEGGQFRHPHLIGIYRDDVMERSAIALSFIDRFQGRDRLNIVGPVGRGTGRHRIALISGVWMGQRYERIQLDHVMVADLIQMQQVAHPGIQSVRLAVPFAGRRFGPIGSFSENVSVNLALRGRPIDVQAPQGGYNAGGPVVQILCETMEGLDTGATHLNGAHEASPLIIQANLTRIEGFFSDIPNAFRITGF